MHPIRIALAAVLLISLVLRSEEPAERRPEDPVECELRLRNGSLIRGKLAAGREVRIKRKGEVKAIPLAEVWRVSWDSVGAEAMDKVFARGAVHEGELLEMDPLEVDTGFGTLRIPDDAIASLRVVHAAGSFGFDFAGPSLAGWTAAGRSTWAVAGGALTVQPAAPGDTLLFDEPLDGPYTLEVDVTCTDWAAVIFHAGDGEPEVALWLIPGSVSFYGNGNWKNTLLRSWPAAVRAGVAAHVRLEVDGKKVKVSLDGAAIGEIEVRADRGRIGFGGWTAPATFDNLKVTR